MSRPFSLFATLAVSALLAVTACNTAPSFPAPEKPAEKAQSRTAMPAYLPQYPGATIKAQMLTPGGHGGVLVMETTDAIDKVIGFYDGKAKEAGVSASIFTSDKDGAVRIYGDSMSASGGLLAVSPRDDGPGSEIVLTMGRGMNGDPSADREPMATSEQLR